MVLVLVKAGEVTTLVEVLMSVSHEVMVLLTIGVMIAVIVAVGVYYVRLETGEKINAWRGVLQWWWPALPLSS